VNKSHNLLEVANAARGLRELVPAMDATAAERAATAIAAAIAAAEIARGTPDNVDQERRAALGNLAQALIAVADKVDRREAPKIASALTVAKAKMSSFGFDTPDLDKAIQAAATRYGAAAAGDNSRRIVDGLLSTLDKAVDQTAIDQVAKALLPTNNLRPPGAASSEPVPGPLVATLATSDLVRLLAHPLAGGQLRRVVLVELSERYHRVFRGTWDFLDWARATGMELAPAPATPADAGKTGAKAGQ
jgi:hypothetical protein